MTSCKEKMELTLGQSSSKIVIEGSVTNEIKHHSVRISMSTDYFYNDQSPKVSGAIVMLSDGTNEYVYKEETPGIYNSEIEFAGVPGSTYKLSVEYKGQTYTASSTMISVPSIDSIGLEKALIPIQPGVILDPDKNYYNILLYCQEPAGTSDYYLMDAYKNGVLLTDTITKKGFTDDAFYNGSYINGVKALQIVADPNDTITFQLASIEKQYCYFILALRDAGMSGSPFTGPPSNIIGNVSNGGLGYFYATAVSLKTRVVR